MPVQGQLECFSANVYVHIMCVSVYVCCSKKGQDWFGWQRQRRCNQRRQMLQHTHTHMYTIYFVHTLKTHTWCSIAGGLSDKLVMVYGAQRAVWQIRNWKLCLQIHTSSVVISRRLLIQRQVLGDAVTCVFFQQAGLAAPGLFCSTTCPSGHANTADTISHSRHLCGFSWDLVICIPNSRPFCDTGVDYSLKQVD